MSYISKWFLKEEAVFILSPTNEMLFSKQALLRIIGRIWEHKNKKYPNGFTAKYNCDKLVYYEFYPHVEEAIAAEKLIKGGSRKKKIQLIMTMNPEWRDLYDVLLAE